MHVDSLQKCEFYSGQAPVENPEGALYGITQDEKNVWVQNGCKITVNVCYKSKFLFKKL